jgi:O-antigen ligase
VRYVRATINRWLYFSTRSYTISVLALFFCVADQALGHAGLLPTSPTLLCLILLSPFGITLLVRHCTQPACAGPFRVIAENFSALAPLAVVALTALMLAALPGTYWSEGGKWVFLVPYGVCIVCSAMFLGRWLTDAALLPRATLLSNTLLALSVWYDTLHPGTFAPITNRAAGFPGNANFAALVSVILCAGGLRFGRPVPVGLTFTERYRRDRSVAFKDLAFNILLLVTTFGVVCMTMSRSGLVNFTALASLYLGFRFIGSSLPPRQRAIEVLALLVAITTAITFAVAFTQISGATQSNSRLTRLLHNQRVDDGSAGTRYQALREGVQLIEAAPFLGHGTGFARRMSELPHNIYIQQWVNNGLPGVLSYVMFLLSALLTFVRRGSRNGIALIIVATIGGIFSHNLLDQRPFLIMFGILLGYSAKSQQSVDIVRSPAQHRSVPKLISEPPSVSAAQVIAQ